MKHILFALPLFLIVLSCKTTDATKNTAKPGIENAEIVVPTDTLHIAKDSTEYEIIIIDPGFNYWLATQPSANYYTQQFLESKNLFYVQEWNRRAMRPLEYNPNIYEMTIDYDPFIDYGLEVNYKLYQYFKYVNEVYHQHL